jgi:hypothetical protein
LVFVHACKDKIYKTMQKTGAEKSETEAAKEKKNSHRRNHSERGQPGSIAEIVGVIDWTRSAETYQHDFSGETIAETKPTRASNRDIIACTFKDAKENAPYARGILPRADKLLMRLRRRRKERLTGRPEDHNSPQSFA